MILRFMGDMPEPKETAASPEGKGESGSSLKKLYGTIKGRFGKSKEEADGGGGGGGGGAAEQVRWRDEGGKGWEGG